MMRSFCMKTTSVLLVATAAMAWCLSSCGTTSGVQTAAGQGSGVVAEYDTLVVKGFRDATSPSGFSSWAAEEQAEHRANVKRCGERMADIVISDAKANSRFKQVGRSKGPGKNLLVEGEITDYNNGVASLRLWIGMGAGSAYLDGMAYFRDASSGKELGRVVIDKNSWPLGGGIAATQTADTFAEGAAKKVASEAAKFAR